MEDIKDMIPYLIPLIFVQLALIYFALRDLIKREKVRGGNKIVWGIVIVLINLFGPLAYFTFGRQEDSVDSD